jgi:hypothetical protein
MKYYKLKYPDDNFKIVKGENAIEIVKKYDLAARKNIGIRIIKLSREQEAITRANDSK